MRKHSCGNIVARNVSTASKRVGSKTNVLLPCRANQETNGETFVADATNVAFARKQGYICVRNNVSATMFPRLRGPLDYESWKRGTARSLEYPAVRHLIQTSHQENLRNQGFKHHESI